MENHRTPEPPRDDAGAAPWRRVAWIVGLLGLLHVASFAGVVPVDDDYIVYRYGRQLLERGEYAFNPGGPLSDGVTSPGWLLVAMAGLALGVAPEVWTPLVGAVSLALLAAVAARALARVAGGRGWMVALGGAVVALSPSLGWHARAGLGTVPVALCLGIALERGLAAQAGGEGAARARRGAGVALAGAVLFRPEALVAVIAALVAPGLRRRWVLVPPLAVALAVTAARALVFGRLVPAAAGLKALPPATELEYGASYLVRSFGEGGLGLVLAAGSVALLRPVPLRWVGATCLLAFLGALAVGGDWMVFGRFFVPFAAFAVVAVLASPGDFGRWAAVGIVALAALGHGARRQAVFENRFFERHWLAVGDALAQRAPADARVALSPVGAVGWRSGLHVVDVLGLTHDAFLGLPPDTENVRVKGHHRHDGAWVLDQRPDYLLLGNARFQPDTGRVDVNPWEEDIVKDPRFERDYVREAFQLPGGERVPYARRRGAPEL